MTGSPASSTAAPDPISWALVAGPPFPENPSEPLAAKRPPRQSPLASYLRSQNKPFISARVSDTRSLTEYVSAAAEIWNYASLPKFPRAWAHPQSPPVGSQIRSHHHRTSGGGVGLLCARRDIGRNTIARWRWCVINAWAKRSSLVLIPLAGLILVGLDGGCAAGPARGRRRFYATPARPARNGSPTAVTPGETRYSPLKQIDTDQRQPAGTRVVLRCRRRRRQPGSHAARMERHSSTASPTGALCLRSTRAPARRNGAGIPEVNQDARTPEDLLRRGESRDRDL